MKTYITLLLLFIYTLGFGQIDTTKVPLVSYWAVGDSYDFQVTKIKKQWNGDKITKNDSSTYKVNFEVIDSTDTSYRIKWRFKTGLYKYKIPKKSLKDFAKYEMTEVIYRTSEVGDFIEIENWQEIAAFMKSLFGDLTDVFKEKGLDNEKINKGLQEILNIYQTKEGIEGLVLTELNYLHFPFGVEYSVGETIEYEDELPSLIGGEPIRGDEKLYVDIVDFDKEYCKIVQEMKLNPEDTKNMISTLFKKLGIDNDEMKQAVKEAKLEINDYNTYEYYYYPGIPIKIETKRTTLFDLNQEKRQRIDKTIIELIE